MLDILNRGLPAELLCDTEYSTTEWGNLQLAENFCCLQSKPLDLGDLVHVGLAYRKQFDPKGVFRTADDDKKSDH